MAAMPTTFETVRTMPEDMALLHFTSGTTGLPKGVVHVHQAVVAHSETGRLALDLKPGDIYWCTADPGWVTGMSYGIISPLCNRVTMVVDEAESLPATAVTSRFCCQPWSRCQRYNLERTPGRQLELMEQELANWLKLSQ